MPNHHNYRFSEERQYPSYKPQYPYESSSHQEKHHLHHGRHHRRDQFPWWLLPFILSSKEDKDYK